ncbi:mu-protocadherin-cell-suface protein [Rhodopirellula europaea]|uniref:Mu-protocadherin-putative cell-suface protein n=1 Tax=Rhodopirellula europaea 6C TaxID=1263867 RepID=M2AKP9_9BACT|nr:mu-protocadherin-cell-suface protein [Rhodopirellula europaea]EMB13277.1 mu-protocadherin-putative cell-suface protein [Rhodopirellula europaea 6C]
MNLLINQTQPLRWVSVCIALSIITMAQPSLDAGGFGGRGGGRGGGGGGRSFSGGGGARPSMGGARPSMGGSANFNRGNMGGNRMPVNRPQTSMPHVGGNNFSRPNVSAPNFNTNRPGTSRPSTGLPSTSRPSIPSTGTRPSRPGTSLPGTSRPDISRPGLNQPGVTRPGGNQSNRPDRPSTLPGNRPGSDRPGSDRPSIDRPNIDRPGNSRPNLPGGDRPGGSNRPGMPDFGKLPAGRPSAGDVGNFLGIDGPLRPGGNERPNLSDRPERPNRPGTPDRPGAGDRPGNGNRPGIGDRPGGGDRPSFADRPGSGTRPGLDQRPNPGDRLPPDRRPNINIGDVNIGNNNIINNKVGWANLDNNRVNQINNRWQNRMANVSNWPTIPPHRFDHFHRWGNQVRRGWHYHGFGPNWWVRHPFRFCGWHYFYSYRYYPYTYWWSTPTYPMVTNWFTPTASSTTLSQPVYYDYGSEGNVTYQDNRVYIGGEEVATTEEFAQTAATLATVEAPADEESAEQSEWLPLGTFALTTDADDVDPDRVIQLAVNKEGIISGTLYNQKTDETQAIQGRVDKETQRVAMRIGESENVVAETGLYNLTQDEASVLVHFGTKTQDTYMLVRLPSPEDSDESADSSDDESGDASNDEN